MEWLNDLRGRRVAVDTAPFIYLIEEHSDYLPLVRPFFSALSAGDLVAITSTVTLLEVLVHPLRRGEIALARRYRSILSHAAGLHLTPMSASIAEIAAGLRARHGLRTPDAIQIATGIHADATHFLTNDTRLASIPGIQILILDRLRTV